MKEISLDKQRRIVAQIVLALSCINALGNFVYPRWLGLTCGIVLALFGIANYIYQQYVWIRLPALPVDEQSRQELTKMLRQLHESE